MIPFLRYIDPISNFILAPKNDYITYLNKVPLELEPILNKNVIYENDEAYNLDLAYQLFLSGYINNNKKEKLIYDSNTISIKDNYKLLARFVSKSWLIVTFFFRVIELNNPFKEFVNLFGSLRIKKISMFKLQEQIKNERRLSWNAFRSRLLNFKPLISVVIPTLNRYNHLKNVLKDLEQQDYKNFEVIIIDQSDNYLKSFFNGWKFKLRHIRQNEKALWRARNTGITISKGEYVLLIDDDIRFNYSFISNHLKAIDFFSCDISNGIFYPKGSKIPKNKRLFGFSEQFPTGNTLLKKSVFKKVGLFDRQFEKQRMGDGEFGTRSYLNGFFSVENPLSSCIDVKASDGGLREMGSWSSWKTSKLFSVRPIPSVLYYSRKYWGNYLSIFKIIITLPRSIGPYKLRNKYYGIFISYILFLSLSPVFLFLLFISWARSTKMLLKGGLIDKLD